MKSVTVLLLLSLFIVFEGYEAALTKKLATEFRSLGLRNGTLGLPKTSPPPSTPSGGVITAQQGTKSAVKVDKSNVTKTVTEPEKTKDITTTSTEPEKTNDTTTQKAELAEESVNLQRRLSNHVSSKVALNNNSALSYYNYPFHQYALPECATQQVCNAVYTRLDRINALCACPQKFGDPCSITFGSDDAHTIELVTDNKGKALTLIKTCEPIGSVRECRGSKDWSLLALQNVRTGKSHYLVVCRCVQHGILEGPIAHENPPYAKIPGIRVYGMICIRDVWARGQAQRGSRSPRDARAKKLVRRRNLPEMPWHLMQEFVQDTNWN